MIPPKALVDFAARRSGTRALRRYVTTTHATTKHATVRERHCLETPLSGNARLETPLSGNAILRERHSPGTPDPVHELKRVDDALVCLLAVRLAAICIGIEAGPWTCGKSREAQGVTLNP
jgi:hypothetical protein